MQKTTKQDHKDRAIETINNFISNPENIKTWEISDNKTEWIQRAKQIGVDGYSAQLRESFTTSKSAQK